MRIRERNYKVKLNSLNHKINRKAMLLKQYNFYHDLYREEDNWMLEDEYKEKMFAIEEAINETVATPIGGYVRRYAVV